MLSDADFRAMALQKAIEAMPGHSFKTILEAAEAFYAFLVKDRDDDGPDDPEDLVDRMSGVTEAMLSDPRDTLTLTVTSATVDDVLGEAGSISRRKWLDDLVAATPVVEVKERDWRVPVNDPNGGR